MVCLWGQFAGWHQFILTIDIQGLGNDRERLTTQYRSTHRGLVAGSATAARAPSVRLRFGQLLGPEIEPEELLHKIEAKGDFLDAAAERSPGCGFSLVERDLARVDTIEFRVVEEAMAHALNH